MDKPRRVARRHPRASHRTLIDRRAEALRVRLLIGDDFGRQGRVDSLYELLAAIRATQDEMIKLFEADHALDDLSTDE